ncbi:carboxysome shell carbonic anhydrase [Hydrogenophaga sp.]|uniref:carboxysome shell carbonic anhydrase n=1 Tax=Hydrogenophaga sp. TaxID=1904254 RepID=UPI0019C20C25|nr:carboxysome shell carbonic anhydrase [Hydrogenophaga sp.]MBD3892351.1 carboxysome shell carbonic anhydrase [Hydrogenophaga sp.]
MNTYKRLAALRRGAVLRPSAGLDNPACVMGSEQACEHTLVDRDLNQRLFTYEMQVRGRFAPIIELLKDLSAMQHEADFIARAQQLAQQRLGYSLPEPLLGVAWVNGLDLRALHSHCIFRSFKACIEHAEADQAPWIERMAIDQAFLHACAYHTVDVSPCSDGRLQGLLPFVLRMASHDSIGVKAYAGALFDIELDLADWTRRELERLSGALPGAQDGDYLKIAVYHYSTSDPCLQGCAAHGSSDEQAMQAAATRLQGLRAAVDNTFGQGAAPQTLLIGVDTDTDAILVHLPDEHSAHSALRSVDNVQVFRETLGLPAPQARQAIARAVEAAAGGHSLRPGMRHLVERLLEANLSQIEYVIRHHAGRYTIIGHNERLICAGEAVSEVQLRNKFYFAHLDTVEEGAADMDVGIKIFNALNVSRGLPVPVLVHFNYRARVPGARERALQRCWRVKAAIESRYAALHAQGLLHCQMALSDQDGSERCTLIDASQDVSAH